MPSMLTSWKEISRHLGKGVRTVQRWEIELGLPVRRSGAGSHRTILADPEELNNWARSHSRAPAGAVVDSLRKELATLSAEVSELRERMERVEALHPRLLPFASVSSMASGTALLLRNELQRSRLALRATIEQSQALRGQSRTVRSIRHSANGVAAKLLVRSIEAGAVCPLRGLPRSDGGRGSHH